MECSELPSASSLEEDLALSEDDPIPNEWPVNDTTQSPLDRQHEVRSESSTTSNKRRVDEGSNPTITDCLPLLPKQREPVSRPPLSHTAAVSRHAISSPPFGFPPLPPRDMYVKLQFNGDPSTDTKLRWLSTITKTFHLQRELA
ncbi:hypothetical protein E2C01_010637 [Portunus trituberculatus]|uniref:Uncharacterized protein n=1 Tax=Portunus trituberculatus TaxID=210409 RepID=A0A5B7D8Z4_PORTR|nr:hypothetical protein [Portunus trituberculatus]